MELLNDSSTRGRVQIPNFLNNMSFALSNLRVLHFQWFSAHFDTKNRYQQWFRAHFPSVAFAISISAIQISSACYTLSIWEYHFQIQIILLVSLFVHIQSPSVMVPTKCYKTCEWFGADALCAIRTFASGGLHRVTEFVPLYFVSTISQNQASYFNYFLI